MTDPPDHPSSLLNGVAASFSTPEHQYTSGELILKFGVNLLTIYLLARVIYYRRHQDHRMLFLLFAFNLFLFPIFLFHSSVTAGFGFTIFALLALVRLRSDTFNKAEVSYLLGSLALTFVNALLPAPVQTVAVTGILLTAYLADHPSLWRPKSQTVRVRYQMSEEERHRALDTEFLRERISREFGVQVTSLELEQVEGCQVRLCIIYRGSVHRLPHASAIQPALAGRASDFFSRIGSRPKW